MKFKKLESGRSMVEMLGVLAIIGVLSVGGIAGYSLSMRRHRANGALDFASKFAVVAYGKCLQKILNGDKTSISNCDYVSWSNTDLNNLPSGITGLGAIGFSSADGYDNVRLSMEFDDDQLCKTVGSVVGAPCDSLNRINFNIKQN